MQGGARVLGVLRRNRASLLLGTALQATALLVVALPADAQPSPNARPMGGSVVAGAASISTPNATTTAINQSSQRAAINWQSFDVGSQQSVNFNQPSASAITLNRVTGPDPSAIAGQIHANGQLVLTNPSGVVFYRGAQVNAQALVVSAPGITTQNFMAGKMVFDQPAKPGALVSNAGTITVKQAGLAGLVAPQVANSGTINARMGHVVLAGAEAHTVDLYGDGLMSIDVTKQVTQAPIGPDGKPVAALVTNTGLIRADGGTVQLTAAAADGIVQNLVDAGGRIQANSVGSKTGTVTIAGTGGSVTVSGQVLATGTAPGTTGGQIEVNATGTANVASTARINASGRAGGGTVALGTTLARAIGGPSVTPTMTAARTVVQHGARIAASAGGRGNGGQVTLLSSGLTNFSGRITAHGGATGGNGGNVEISGAGVSLHGSVDVTAPHGAMGNITLDPANLTITNSGANNGELTDNQDPNLAYNTPNTTTDASVTPAALAGLHGNVHLQATDNLYVASSLTLTTAGESLRLEAGDNLTVEPNVTISTAGNINLSAATATIPGFNAAGGLSLVRGATVTTSNGSVTLSAGSAAAGSIGIRIDNSSVIASSGQTIALNADNIDVYGSALALRAPNGVIAIAPTTAGRPVELLNLGTFVAGALGVSQYEVGLMSAATLRLGSSTAGPISIGSGTGDHVILNGIGSLAGGVGTLDLESGAGVTEPGSFAVNTLIGNAQSAVSLGSISNTIAILGGFGAPAGFTLGNTGDIDITGAVNGGTGIAIQTQANGTLSAGAITIGAPLSATSVGLIGAGISETGIGVITAGTLTGSGTGISLGGANSIGDLGALSSTGSLLLDNISPLSVTGSVHATGLLSVTETGALTLANGGVFNAASVAVASSGAFTETGNGAVIATALSGSASAVSLNGSGNQVGSLAGFITTSGNFSLTDSTRLNVTAPVSVASGQTLSLFTDGLTIGPLGGSLTAAGSLSAPGGTIQLAPFTANTPVLVYNIGSAASTGLSIPAGELSSMSASTLQLGSATTSGVTIGNAGDLITIAGSIAPTLAVLTNATGTVTEGGPLTVGTLTGTAGSLVFDYLNQIGTLGSFTTNTGLALTNGTGLTVTGPLNDGQGITLLVNNGDLTLAGNLTAPTIGLYAVIGSVTNAGNIVQTAGLISASNALYLNAASGNVTQSGGSITATTLSVPTAAGVSLNSATNSIVNLGSVTVDPGAFSLVDGRALNATGNVYVTGNATLNVAGNLSLRAFLVSNATLDLIATGGAISEPNYGYVVARQLTGQAASASLTRANNIGTLGSFLTNTGFTLTNRTGLSVTGPVTDTNTGVTLTSSGSLNLSGSITAPSIALTANTYQGDFTVPGNITQTAGVLNGRTLVALNAGGSIAQTGGSITSALLEANAPTGVSLVGPANLVTDLGSSSSAGGFAFANAESLTVVGPVRDPPGVTLSATGDLTISNAVSGPTVSLTATGAITETSTGSVSATTLLTGSSGAATTLGQIANSVANLGSFTAGTDFLLTDSVPLSVSGTVSAGSGRTLELDDNAPTLATGSLLSAPGGLVVIAPATANTAVALGSASGIGTRPAVNAATLRIGSTTAGSISIAGSFDLVGAATLDLESAAAINEIAAGSASALGMIVANTLIGNGLSASLGGANSITTLGSFHTANGFSLSNAQSLTVAGPVIDTNTGVTISVNPGSLTLAGNITAPSVLARSTTGPLTQQSGTLTGTLSVGLYGGAVTQSGGAIITNTLRSTGSTITLGGATNSVASVGLLEATSGNVTFDDSTGFAIAGTIGPLGSASAPGTIGLFTGGAITESTGGEIIAALLTGQAGSATLNQTNAVQSVGSFTSNGGFLLDDGTDVTLAGPLHDNTSIAVTTSGNIDVTGSVAAPGISLTSNIGVEFPVGGTIVLAGTLAGGAVSLLGEKSIVQTGGVISATTLTGGSTFYGTSLTSPTNTIGSLGSFSSNGGFSLVDTAPLAIIGNVSDPTSVSLVSQSAITQTAGSITTALLTGSGAGVQLIQPGNSITSLGSFASSGNFALTDGAPITVSGSVTVGTGDTLTLADNAPSFAAAGSLIAAGGTVVLAPATAGDALTLGGPGGFAAGSAVSANTLQIGAANAGSITITGALDLIGASTLDLVSSSTIAETGAGAVAAPVLIGSGTAATLTGANSITSLGSFHTANGFALTNAQSLTVAGPVTDTNTGVTISVNPGGLTLAGSIGGPIIDLIAGAGGIAQTGGSVSAGNTISLRSTGSISQSGGGLIANALNVYQTGGAGVSLTATGNTIANLGSVTTTPGNFALVDQSGLNVAGPVVVAPGNVTLNAAGSLSINGFLSGDGVDLIAGDITAPAGSVHATTLTGDARSLNFSGSAVYVGTIGSFTTTNGFTLADRPSGLTVSGPVIDNVGITLTSHGTMTVSGTVDAPNVSLNAVAYQGTFGASPGVISQTGGLIDGATGVALSASGSIAQTGGSLVAGVLSGNSGGTTSLPEATNAIAALGSFVSTGAITLADGEGLAITGAVSAPALGVSIGGALTEPSGSLSVTTLAGSASSTSLGQIANSIANLGSFSTSGDFSLTDGAPLSIAGSVVVGTGHTLTLADNAPSFAAGGSLIAAGGTVVLTPPTPGNALTLGGGTGFGAGSAVSANTLQIGSSTAGSITITGALDLAGASTLDLVS
ncbi:MAG: filamentous hemagglutinin N-terminal domain-containing protein, partial [Acidisphaera sp.]|nr:filamentous hemagglutinin N-terminal domain-containing protein [Acidisphaera sp.]